LLIKKGIKEKEFFDPSFLFFLSLLQITPALTLKRFKKGSGSFDVPLPLPYWKKISMACKWIIKFLKQKQGLFTVQGIVDILIASITGGGSAMHKKFDLYYIASINRHLLRRGRFLR